MEFVISFRELLDIAVHKKDRLHGGPVRTLASATATC
jgi:hypothetical protein